MTRILDTEAVAQIRLAVDDQIEMGCGVGNDTVLALLEHAEATARAPGGPQEQPESILCAATHYEDEIEHVHEPTKTGIVFCAWRHHVTFGHIMALFPNQKAGIERNKTTETCGFLTSKNRFVDRAEALRIALERGQVIEGDHPIVDDELFSEDLY